MFDSPTPIRSKLVVGTTPSFSNDANDNSNNDTRAASKRIFSPAKPSLDEENQQVHNNNNNNSTKQSDPSTLAALEQRLAKKNRIGTTPTTSRRLSKKEDAMKQHEEITKHHRSQKAWASSTILNSPTASSSECETETSTSSVAARRDWLQNFGKQHEKNPFRKPAPVSKSIISVQQQSRDDDDTHDPRSVKTSASNVSSGNSSSAHGKPPKTPDKNSAAAALMNRLVLASSSPHTPTARPINSAATVNATSTAAMRRTSTFSGLTTSTSTPLRSTRQARQGRVMATDEGYASVKELSQWLASDPTSTKKKKQVRRGRNVILKSRQFEKGQENVIIVENKISKGAVKDKQKWLQSAFHKDDDDASSIVSDVRYAKSEIAGGTGSYSFSRFRDAGHVPSTSQVCDSQSEIITDDTASSLSVADKKDWLKNAFSGKSAAVAAPSPAKMGYAKARTDVMYNRRPCRDEAASRAKMRFKERSARKLMESTTLQSTTKVTDQMAAASASTRSEPEDSIKIQDTCLQEVSPSLDVNATIEEDTASVDFRAARNALVQRSKKNGHKVDIVNKVYLRKKKYEKIEEENKKSNVQGLLLKSSWDHADPSKGLPSNSFEKKFVSDIAPKKSFDELP